MWLSIPQGGQPTIAQVHNSSVLARTDHDPGRLRREATEPGPGRLVRTMLRPHHGIHRQLCRCWLATEDLDHGVVFGVGHAESDMVGDDRRHVGSPFRDRGSSQRTRGECARRPIQVSPRQLARGEASGRPRCQRRWRSQRSHWTIRSGYPPSCLRSRRSIGVRPCPSLR